MKQAERIEILEGKVSTLETLLNEVNLRLTTLEKKLSPEAYSEQEFVKGLDGITRYLIETGSMTIEEVRKNIRTELRSFEETTTNG